MVVLPLLSAGLAYGVASGPPEEAYAGPFTITREQVCGDRLCSEYPGGRNAFDDAMREAAAERAASVGSDEDGVDERIAAAIAANEAAKSAAKAEAEAEDAEAAGSGMDAGDGMDMSKDMDAGDGMDMSKDMDAGDGMDMSKDMDAGDGMDMSKDMDAGDGMDMSKDKYKDRDDGMSKDKYKDRDDGMSKDKYKDRDDGMSKDKYKDRDDGMSKDKYKDRDKDMDAGDDMDMSKDKYKDDAAPALRLSRANVPAVIPMSAGYYDGGDVYYITTDSSDPTHASIISESTGWNVEMAPSLADAPDGALATAYMFTNGVEGAGMHGFQGEVFTATPAQEDMYSALTGHMHVTWNEGSEPTVLKSEADILSAEEAGDLTLSEISVVLNMPQIVWPDGQMAVKEDAALADDTEYGGGQVIDIDTDAMTVTFVAHRGWGPDGRTAYYIVTDATPKGPADMMGVVSAPSSASLIANPAAVDLYQFANGVSGTGPLGFQPGIATAALGDESYSPCGGYT